MASELREQEERGPAVAYNKNAVKGPTGRSLANILRKTGAMGGGDSPCYCWGYVIMGEDARV